MFHRELKSPTDKILDASWRLISKDPNKHWAKGSDYFIFYFYLPPSRSGRAVNSYKIDGLVQFQNGGQSVSYNGTLAVMVQAFR
jgi:hypothetical protein